MVDMPVAGSFRDTLDSWNGGGKSVVVLNVDGFIATALIFDELMVVHASLIVVAFMVLSFGGAGRPRLGRDYA